jgi:hypothetical protein
METSAQKKRCKTIKMKKVATTRTLARRREHTGYNNKQKPHSKNFGGLAIGIGYPQRKPDRWYIN